jgi:hypothetical protein
MALLMRIHLEINKGKRGDFIAVCYLEVTEMLLRNNSWRPYRSR